MAFLDNYGFSGKEKEEVWEYCGGKPAYLVKEINKEFGVFDAKEEVGYERLSEEKIFLIS